MFSARTAGITYDANDSTRARGRHGLADPPSVNQEHVENAGLVCVGARVEPELALALRQLAEAGDRPLSREIRRALIEHVAKEDFSPTPPSQVGPARLGEERSSPGPAGLRARREA